MVAGCGARGSARYGDSVTVVTGLVGDCPVVGERDSDGFALVVDREEAGVVFVDPPPLVPAIVTDSFPFGADATQAIDFVWQFGALPGVGRRAWIV